jgi:hypothetical protein
MSRAYECRGHHRLRRGSLKTIRVAHRMRARRRLRSTRHKRQEAIARREAGEALVDTARTFGVSGYGS